MELRRGRWRVGLVPNVALVCCISICVLSVCAFITDAYIWSGSSDYRSSGRASLTQVQRRGLGEGPGSSPPRCTAKCGDCTPCRPVLVPVPPGTPVTAEYYPEAWRCKCGDKLYLP